MSEVHAQYRVLVIGGGPAGLLAAQAFKKRGIRCTVYEQDAALDARPRDWNFGIYWAQAPLGDCLSDELSKRVVEHAQVDNRPMSSDDFMPIYNGQNGDLLRAVPTPNGLRLHRRNFLRILGEDVDIRVLNTAACCPEIQVDNTYYGKRLRTIETDGSLATAHFEDGTSDSGNLIVGAEGVRSKVREILVGEENSRLEKSPIVASVAMAILPEEAAKAFQQVHPRYAIILHPGGSFSWVGVHDAFSNTKPGDWTFMMIQSWLPKVAYDPKSLRGADILADTKERAKVYAEPFRSIFQSIPEGTQCWHNQLSYWIPQPWDNRNSTVTLVGDAAHPMTFHRGQGLNNAIHDVASLVKLLHEIGTRIPADGSESAVTTYEREMVERGKEAVIGSRDNTLLTHDWNTVLESPLLKSGLRRPEAKSAGPNETNVKA